MQGGVVGGHAFGDVDRVELALFLAVGVALGVTRFVGCWVDLGSGKMPGSMVSPQAIGCVARGRRAGVESGGRGRELRADCALSKRARFSLSCLRRPSTMWAGALARKLSLAEFAGGAGEVFLEFGEFFCEALALGGDVDLALVEDGDVEAGGGAGIGAGEWLRRRGETALTRAMRASMLAFASASARVGALAWSWMGVDSFSGTPSSLRRPRTVTMSSWRRVMDASASGSVARSVDWGKRVRAMDFAGAFAWWRVCQISSVRKGMKGLRRRSAVSKTLVRMASEVAVSGFRGAGASGSPKSRRSLTSSRYQSQSSPQKNW